MSTILAAPDKFRGSASAREVAAGVAAAADAVGWSCVQLPLADGGEGTLDAFGGANRSTTVTGPLGGRVDAEWRLGEDGVATIQTEAEQDGRKIIRRGEAEVRVAAS